MPGTAERYSFYPEAVQESVRVISGSRTIEKKRNRNEDDLIVDPKHGLFAVFDGLGGHRGGQEASHLASETFLKHALGELNGLTPDQKGADILRGIGEDINDLIRKVQGENEELRDMGTTVSFLRLTKNAAGEIKGLMMHAGDSRIYLYRAGELVQLTRDNLRITEGLSDADALLVTEKLDAAEKVSDLNEDERRQYRLRNQITQGLGLQERPSFQVEAITFQPGDRIVLATDGYENLTKDEMREICNENEDAYSASNALAEYAYDRSKDLTHFKHKEDDITFVVVDIPKEFSETSETGNVVEEVGRDRSSELLHRKALRAWSEKWFEKVQNSQTTEDLLGVVKNAGGIIGKKPGEWISSEDLYEIQSDAELSGDFSAVPSAGGYKKRFIELLAAERRREAEEAA